MRHIGFDTGSNASRVPEPGGGSGRGPTVDVQDSYPPTFRDDVLGHGHPDTADRSCDDGRPLLERHGNPAPDPERLRRACGRGASCVG